MFRLTKSTLRVPARLLVCTAVAGSAALAAGAIPGGIAGAVTPLTVTCTTLSGNASTQNISGCTGTGAISADAGTPPAHGVSTVSTKTIKWSNGKTSVSKVTYTPASDATCPTVAKYTKFLLENAKGTVNTGSAGGTAVGMRGGAWKATICAYKQTAAPHAILVKNKGPVHI